MIFTLIDQGMQSRYRFKNFGHIKEGKVESFYSFLPMLFMQVIYSIFVAQIAKRTGRNVPLYVIGTIVPFFGMFFFIYVMWSTFLRMLDSINEIKAKSEGAA